MSSNSVFRMCFLLLSQFFLLLHYFPSQAGDPGRVHAHIIPNVIVPLEVRELSLQIEISLCFVGFNNAIGSSLDEPLSREKGCLY